MMDICPITASDIPACLDIYNYYVRNTTFSFEEKELTLSEFSDRVARISSAFPYLVVHDEVTGRVLGYAYLDYYNTRSAYRFTADVSVYLDRSVVQKGLGTALYGELEKKAKEKCFRSLISLITGENLPSVRFHEKMGFSRKGTLSSVGFKFGKWLDLFLYQKEIL